jgi:ATP-dependent Lhr-like helicase
MVRHATLVAFAFQEEVWSRGRERPVDAPTGMGKTYAAWIPPLVLGPAGATDAPPPLTALWITPLRALAADTGLVLARAARALQPHWTVDVRTGDTASSARARQNKRPPPRSSPRRRVSR